MARLLSVAGYLVEPIGPPPPVLIAQGPVADIDITLSGGPFGSGAAWHGVNAVDMGDYVGPFVHQKSYLITNAGFPDWRVWIRVDADGSGNRIVQPATGWRDEIIIEYGRSTHGTPTNAGAYTAQITKGGVNVSGSPFSIPKQWWYSRWWYESAPRAIVRTPAQAIAAGLLPPFGSNGMFGLTKLTTTVTWGGPFTTPNDPTLGLFDPILADTGANPHIGHLTERAADYVIFGGSESLASVRIEGQWVANWAMHVRDDTTLGPVDARNGHLGYAGDGGTLNECPAPSPTDSDFVHCRNSDDTSHWYPVAYLGAVLFDDPKMIEEHQFGANQCVLINLFHRSASLLWGIPYPVQTRGFAWGLRELMRAAAITPASVPTWLQTKSYWQSCVADCKTFALRYVTSAAKVHSVFRIWTLVNFVEAWQQDFLLAVVAYGYDLGFTDWHDGTANDIYAWAVDYLIQTCRDRAGGAGWRREYPVPFIHHPLLGSTQQLLYCDGYAGLTTAQADALTFNSWDDHWTHPTSGYFAGENVSGSGSWRDVGQGPGGLGTITATLDGTTIVEDLEHSDEFFYELRAAVSMAAQRNVSGAAVIYSWLQNQFTTNLLPHYGGANASRGLSGPYARWSIDPPADALTTLLAGMAPGSWKAVPNSTLSSAIYANDTTNTFSRSALGADYNLTLANNIAGSSGPGGIMNAWGGAVLDTTNDRLLAYGGGHFDYYGNEIYAFDLKTLTWIRWTTPSNPAVISSADDTYSDGKPVPIHTYGVLTWLPDTTEMVVTGGGNWSPSGGFATPNDTFAYSFTTNTWAKINAGGITGSVNNDVLTVYNPNDKAVYAIASALGLQKFNRTTATWSAVGSSGILSDYHMSADIAPTLGTNGKIFAVGHNVNTAIGFGGLNIVDLATGAVTSPTITGDLTAQNFQSQGSGQGAPGVAWDSVAHVLTAWAGNGSPTQPPGAGGTVYTLDPVALAWTAHTATGDIPAAPQTNGTFGRFRYVPSHDCYVLVNDISQPVYIYKKNF